MYTADFDAFMPILFQTDFMKAQTVWNTFMAGPIPPNMNIAVATLKANVNFQLLLRTIVDVFDCNYVLAQYLVYKGPIAFRNQIGTYVDLKNCYRNVFGDYFLANIMDLYDRQLLWTHMFATHPAGFWADILISVNPTEFGRIAFKYFPNEANQLMINANISITDYFSLIESYPGLGNAYLSNLKNTLMNMGYTAAGWTYLADEHHIYGSSRVGVHNTHFVLAKRFSTAEMEYTQKTVNQVHFIRGKRNYELSNHLGNVQVVISDKRISVCDNELQTERFEADILMATDYYPFGMAIPERQWYTGSDSSNYRYGFNGMEKDNEAKGPGNSLDFGARIYDSRLGRWFAIDPLMSIYPALSPFNYVDNSPIRCKDGDGKDIIILTAPAKHGEGKHPTGHQAALIGNDKDGWFYYSYDNDNKNIENDNFTSGVKFSSVEEFANSEYNTFKADYDDGKGVTNSERDADGKIIQRYTEGYRIVTTVETDEKMKKAAEITFYTPYSLSGNNCTSVITNALDAGGLNNGEYSLELVSVPNNPGMKMTQKVKNHFPEAKQREIEKSNVGTDVDDKIKRTTKEGDKKQEPILELILPDRVRYQQDGLNPNRSSPRID